MPAKTFRGLLLDDAGKPMGGVMVEVRVLDKSGKPTYSAKKATTRTGRYNVTLTEHVEEPQLVTRRLAATSVRTVDTNTLSEASSTDLQSRLKEMADAGALTDAEYKSLSESAAKETVAAETDTRERAVLTDEVAAPAEVREVSEQPAGSNIDSLAEAAGSLNLDGASATGTKDGLAGSVGTVDAAVAESVQLREVSVMDFLVDTGTQLDSAQTRLAETDSSFRISNISMDLKYVSSTAEDGSSRVALPGYNELTNLSDQLSSLHVDYASSGTKGGTGSTGDALHAPSVMGYTLSVARRKLEEAGFHVDVGYQAVRPPRRPNMASQVGRVVRQSPDPTNPIDPGSLITLLVGKESV